MEIPEKGSLQSLPARNCSPEEPARPAIKPNGMQRATADSDTVRLTEKGRAFKTSTHYVRSLPEIREDRVMRLKRQLEEGAYRIAGDRIAGSMLDEALENNTILKHIDTKA